MYVSDAGLLYTSGLVMTNKMFFDLRIVTLVTPVTCLRPSFDIAYKKQWTQNVHNCVIKGVFIKKKEKEKISYFSCFLFTAALFGFAYRFLIELSGCCKLIIIKKEATFIFKKWTLKCDWIHWSWNSLLRTVRFGFSLLRRTKVTVKSSQKSQRHSTLT